MALPDYIAWTAKEAAVSVLTTELNALANNTASAASATQDQDATRFPFADFELTVTFATAPVRGMRCMLIVYYTIDDTNFAASSLADGNAEGMFLFDNIATIQRVYVKQVPLLPRDFKVAILNEAGVAFPASGSLLKMSRYQSQITE